MGRGARETALQYPHDGFRIRAFLLVVPIHATILVGPPILFNFLIDYPRRKKRELAASKPKCGPRLFFV